MSNVSCKTFVSYQRNCNSVKELANMLDMSESYTRQRIKKLRDAGYGKYLKPYADAFDQKDIGNQLHELGEYIEPVYATDEMKDELIAAKANAFVDMGS